MPSIRPGFPGIRPGPELKVKLFLPTLTPGIRLFQLARNRRMEEMLFDTSQDVVNRAAVLVMNP